LKRRMSEMPDKFQADVKKTFWSAARHRDVITRIKKHARENPELLAMRVVDVVPERLKAVRTVGFEVFKLNLADAEAVRNFEANSVAEWQIVNWLASYYQMYSACWRLIGQYAVDPNLRGVRSAQAVCEAFVEATEQHLYTIALDFDDLRKQLPGQRFPSEELAKILIGIVATRTSLHRNQRLRAAIDELREHSKDESAKRERFEQLLKELQGQVLEVWAETEHSLASLSEIKTEAVRRIEKPSASSQVQELAEFADREELLRLAKAAKLSPQEMEVFALSIANPQIKPREIAERLGRSSAQIRVVKYHIKQKLEAIG
jgi:DNA-binding CsgD family transcriptional regulator